MFPNVNDAARHKARHILMALLCVLTFASIANVASAAHHRVHGHPSISTRGRHPVRHRHIAMPGIGSAVAANPYTHGGCTFWAWANRSDLPGNLGDARYWAQNAARAGFPVDNTPEVGAIAVYQPGVYGAFGHGHVAVVEQISGTRIYISEASFDTRFPDYGDHEIYHRWTGIQSVQFIHHKPTPVVIVPTTPPTTPVSNQDPPQAQPANLLANPGFETEPGAPGWFRNNLAASVNEQVYNAPASAHGGSWFFETNTSQLGGSIAQDLAIAPGAGDDYQFSIWLRSPSGSPYSACPTIWALGAAGNTPGQTCVTVGGAWQQVTARLAIPAGTPAGRYSKVRVEVYEKTTGLNLDLDDASLVQQPLSSHPGPQ